MQIYRYIIIWSYILGVVLYDWIQLTTGFSYTDEIIACILAVSVFLRRKADARTNHYLKKLKCTFIIFLFYIMYSVHISSNVRSAILGDFFIQIKPYAAFFCTGIMGLTLDGKGKCQLRQTILFLFPVMSFVGLGYYIHEAFGHFGFDFLKEIFGHPSRYATTCQISGLLYLYCSKRSRRDINVMFSYFVISLFSLRSKSYAFAVVAFVLYYVWNGGLKINAGHVLLIVLTACMVLYVSWNKLNFYFIIGSGNPDGLFARPALYYGALEILKDYFPFGSGLASFATIYAVRPYSHIYYDYGLNKIQGLSESNPVFSVDTFYPSLAQFGIAGVLLFVLFLSFIWKEIIRMYHRAPIYGIDAVRACILIFVSFLTECAVDSTFTQNRGMFMLMLMGMFLNESYAVGMCGETRNRRPSSCQYLTTKR